MGKLIRLELFNFKSYKGHHVLLFGDSYFTSIIGPNGSGKSNSMDAISFVLGIKSSHLRSTHLRDLIYRGRVLKTSKINADGTATAGGEIGDVGAPADEHNYGDVVSEEEDTQSSTQRNDPTSAWVMAVYEDEAGEEQLWKRSISSAGQSEYRINNRVVNAKQYNEALERENILIKARNFLVFQGDVEAIASQSPKDLTRLIEQISGSLEFKADYDKFEEESAKAADDQTVKHNQRRQINGEIKQFSEQKKEADNYANTVAQRDEAIVTHVLWKLYHFQRVMEQSEHEIQRHQHELKEQRREVAKLEEHVEAARKEQAKTTRELTKIEKNVRATEKEVEDKENALVPIDEKIAISTTALARYTKRIDEVTKERDEQSATVEQLQKNLDTTKKAQRKWADDWKKAAQQQGRQLQEADLQEYNRLKGEVNKRTASDQIAIDNLTRQRKTDEETVNSLKSKVDDCERAIEKLNSEIQSLRERKDAMDSQVKNTSKEIDLKKKEYNSVTSERLRMQQKHTELDEKLREVLNKLLEADDGRRQTEKEVRAKELVAAMKHIFPGVRGRVHELCKPMLKKYDTAVSTVLGRHFDSIVVDSEKTAKECIGYLRDQRAGQATFIPLDTIQVKNVNSNLKGMHKKMRLAIDTIEYESSVERAMSYACGDAMICDDLETAKYLCFDKRIEAKAVTLDGTIIHKGGLMTGGRGNNDKGARKWEDTEVENLRRLKDKFINEMSALPQGHKAVTDEETLQGELSGLEQQLSNAREESQAFRRNLDSKEKELKFNQVQLREARPKYQEQSQSLGSIQEKVQDLTETVSEVEDTIFASFCQRLGYADVRAYDAQQGTLQQEAADKKLEFTKQISKLENQLTFERGRLQSTTDRIKSITDKSQRDRELVDSLEEEKQAMQSEIDELESRLTTMRESVEQHKARSDGKGAVVSAHRKELQTRKNRVEDSLKAVAESETELHRNAGRRHALLRKCKIDEIDIPLEEESASLDSLPVDETEASAEVMEVDEDAETGATQAPRDYGIVLDFSELHDDLKDVGEDDDDRETAQEAQLESAISDLNAQLSTLAPNMRAVDRLNSATDRLKDTDAEYDASREHARATREAFETVRTQRAELFNKAYTHIAEQIGHVYKALTKSAAFPLGGSAFLDTMGADEEAPFLGGTKYNAMPPLKRFRDMDALSGGEKTIAALALLFAIHSYSPSPFFVLDEVDAALDNANVAKVARYIKEHARPGMQFIVISLKAGLFQESQCLVGILRDQTANSSRAITLDLRKYRPT